MMGLRTQGAGLVEERLGKLWPDAYVWHSGAESDPPGPNDHEVWEVSSLEDEPIRFNVDGPTLLDRLSLERLFKKAEEVRSESESRAPVIVFLGPGGLRLIG